MYLPTEALLNLWEWAKGKHTKTLAESTGRSSQHIRNVLKGLAEDREVLRQAIALRKKILLEDRAQTLELLKDLATT